MTSVNLNSCMSRPEGGGGGGERAPKSPGPPQPIGLNWKQNQNQSHLGRTHFPAPYEGYIHDWCKPLCTPSTMRPIINWATANQARTVLSKGAPCSFNNFQGENCQSSPCIELKSVNTVLWILLQDLFNHLCHCWGQAIIVSRGFRFSKSNDLLVYL